MDLALRSEDAELVAALDALLAKESSPERIRAAETLGFDPALWRALNTVGVPALATGEGAARMEQLALIAEQAGRHLASAPVVETLVTARLLEHCDRAEPGIVTLVLHPTREPVVPLVPAGAVADAIVRFDGDELTVVRATPPMAASPNLGSLPLADRQLSSGEVVPLLRGARATGLFAAAQRDWQLLTAAQLVGLADRALEMGVEYVKGREIFGRPVGAFQTVAHRLADHATALDGARLLVQEAAWAVDVADPRSAGLATMAFCFAAEQALAISGDSLHYHGGYGFSLEYDIQLYYRRAKAYPLVRGSVRQEYQVLADHLFGSVPEGAR